MKANPTGPLHGRWLVAVLLLAVASAACGGDKCRVSSECPRAQHCDFTRGACVSGCNSNAICEGSAVCDLMRGTCGPPPLLFPPDTRRDGGAATSTTADAAATDAATVLDASAADR